jgi:hypothetical protein
MSDWLSPAQRATLAPTKPPVMLRCVCCKIAYERGHFTCCAPPHGMRTDVWMSLHCVKPDKSFLHCARHCTCPPDQRPKRTKPLQALADAFLATVPGR